MDALTMQNWEHVKACHASILVFYYSHFSLWQFVMNHMNKLPKESRDTDFSRIKPWYLDGQYVLLPLFYFSCQFHPMFSAPYLRQSILLSAYETVETRSLYNASLKNVAGKIRTEKHWPAVEVPEGIDQASVSYSPAKSLILIALL
jgi:U3 small nucleolar RNA-associated protein 25